MGLFLGAFEVGGLPQPLECVALRPPPFGDDRDPYPEVLRDLGLLSRRLGSPTAIYQDDDLGQVVLALVPVDAEVLAGVRGREYRAVGSVALDAGRGEDRRTVVRLVHQGLRDYMASRTDFMTVGRNAYANTRPASEEGGWFVHRRMAFRVDHPGTLTLAVDVGQMHVAREPLSLSGLEELSAGGRPVEVVLGTPDGFWMADADRVVGELTAGDPVVLGPGGERETLLEHYQRVGMEATAEVVDPQDPVVYLRRYVHGRAGREEPHAASLAHHVAPPGEAPGFDPPPSARWRIVQGMANQLGRARLGTHHLELDVEAPVHPGREGVAPVPAEGLRTGHRMEPTEERVGRWDAERRNALKAAGVPPGAPRLGPCVLAHGEGVPQGAAGTLYGDVRYNLYRYLGTKADPRPVRTMEFGRVAELGALLATVRPRPSAVVVAARDPVEAYLGAKAVLPEAAVQAMAADTLASRPTAGGEEGEGDAAYFNSVLWLATALEREAGRAPWTIEAPLATEAYLGISLLGRAHLADDRPPSGGLVVAVDARHGGRLHLGGVVPMERGRLAEGPMGAAVGTALGSVTSGSVGPPASITVHWEGAPSRGDREGLEAMVEGLPGRGLLAEDARAELVELSVEHPYRIFQEGLKGPATCKAGSWAALDDRTALLATAGYPVKTRGVPEVLMVTCRSGADPVTAALDVQALGALDWGGSEVRWPATIWGPRADMGAHRVRPWG